MKRIFTPLMLSLFFFIPKVVFGATYTIELSQSVFDVYKNNLSTIQSSIASQNVTSYFILSRGTYVDTSFIYNWSGTPDAIFNQNGIRIRITSGSQGYFNENWQYTSSLNASSAIDTYFPTRPVILYSTQPIKFFNTLNNTYVFTYGEYTYQIQHTAGNEVPTIAFLYDYWQLGEPPVPPDNTPLLTTFYTVVIDKLEEICTFFTSNYLYLSVFVIFLFYITILLLRRFIK